jgi:hypothetical protein
MDKRQVLKDLHGELDMLVVRLREVNAAIAAIEAIGGSPKPKAKVKRKPRKPKVVTVTADKQKPIRVILTPPAPMVRRHRRTKAEMQAARDDGNATQGPKEATGGQVTE